MNKIFKNKFFTWSIVATLVFLSPLVLEFRFKDDISVYYQNKEKYKNLISKVQDFKENYYSGRIPKEDNLDLTEEFLRDFKIDNLNIVSVLVEKSMLKVILKIEPSSLACLVRNEVSVSSSLVKSLTPTANCKKEISLYQFSAI